MIFKQFQFNSEQYQQSLELREHVLRAPLGLSLSDSDLMGEDKQLHFALFDKEQITAVVLFKPIDDQTLKLRQMAVSDSHQGQGLGKQLIKAAEVEIAKLNYKRIEMAARETAIPFYQSLGYQIKGELFIELGIPHITMTKTV